ncbi:hypothetical protein POVWA2_021810 [Plasmodium ovale wallikeri]|uniref:Uncharacterized protein n=1 Tax=Plasmodium ovale wallikeri TaxID=864142 RepID=A0A1A8YRU5_PLAOA|nr:hypothetical protein POVWA1_021940 [Plasmodium ovale wallikeri]SBT34816.1 hypothetical protein POVWA2_021810 [Plasmodium ovale wallikeri]
MTITRNGVLCFKASRKGTLTANAPTLRYHYRLLKKSTDAGTKYTNVRIYMHEHINNGEEIDIDVGCEQLMGYILLNGHSSVLMGSATYR